MTSRLGSLREALALSPQNIPLLLLFGQTCLDELNFAEARAAFDRVLRHDPANAEAKLGIAGALYLSGNISEAVVRTEALAKAKPSFAEAWILLTRLALAEGDQTLATENYQRALELNPNLRDPMLDRDTGIEGAATPVGVVPDAESDTWESPEEFDGDANEFVNVERPEVSFASVGGMEDIKEEIRMKIIYPLQNRALFKAYGKKLGGGVLLYGPPGCGKTLISKATAGEIQANFISVGIHQILDLYIGNSEKNLHQLFQLAREAIVKILGRDKPLERLDAKALAKRTKEFSGADLKSIFDIATERVLSRAMKEGRVVPLTTEDLLQACKGMKASTRAWFESAKNYALYANQGGFYDDVLTFLGIRK